MERCDITIYYITLLSGEEICLGEKCSWAYLREDDSLVVNENADPISILGRPDRSDGFFVIKDYIIPVRSVSYIRRKIISEI